MSPMRSMRSMRFAGVELLPLCDAPWLAQLDFFAIDAVSATIDDDEVAAALVCHSHRCEEA